MPPRFQFFRLHDVARPREEWGQLAVPTGRYQRPNVVEVEVTVDDYAHVGGAQVVLRQGVGSVPVDHLPLFDEFGRPTHARIDQDCSRLWMLDHEAVHRDVVEHLDSSQVQPDYLQQALREEG